MHLLSFSYTLTIVALMSCSSVNNQASKGETRQLASKSYECHISEEVGSEKINYSFSPEQLELRVFSTRSGADVVSLEEADFIPGGFVFKQASNNKSSLSLTKLEFISFAGVPKMVLQLKRPNESESVLSRDCSN